LKRDGNRISGSKKNIQRSRRIKSPFRRLQITKELYLSSVTGAISLVACLSLLAEYGFYLTGERISLLHCLDYLLALAAMSQLLFRLALSRDKRQFFRINRADFLFLFFFWGALLAVLTRKGGEVPQLFILLTQAYLAGFLVLRLPAFNRLASTLGLRPPFVVLTTFILIIGLGTVLLLLPRSITPGKSLSVLDALFTATSATCVTGLVVVDTGSCFSFVGQIIILCLVQVGALGLMTFTSFFALLSGREFGVKDRVFLGGFLSPASLGNLGTLISFILIMTFVAEGIGALLLYPQFLPGAENPPQALYYSVFHSISAFCNAGFCLFSDSFVQYQANLRVNLIMTALIVVGGLGFMVNANLLKWIYLRLRKRRAVLTLQTKLVFFTSILLIGAGTVLILLGENKGAFINLPWKTRLLGAYFQSVTTRTAGFNTLDMGSLGLSSTFLLMILMFIGASPGSTGGGIKTSTLATLVFTIKSMAEGKSRIEVFKRTIPRIVIYQSLCVIILALGWIAVSTLALAFTEQASLATVIFENLSAFGTVGLSRGLTSHLSAAGRVIVIATMLVGRIGPLTLALIVAGRRASEHYQYPEESIIVG